ncbi:hypothetical protein F2Q68_00039446 [Brassica cretica]|uniref:Uncharacterized protein n=1 Tax=Brassica cretica TaxID=69181 RepID=A0A8S9MJH8_BRACR|nr:hypothetical protein F2Q68_00039446 [Brassica cretica]
MFILKSEKSSFATSSPRLGAEVVRGFVSGVRLSGSEFRSFFFLDLPVGLGALLQVDVLPSREFAVVVL